MKELESLKNIKILITGGLGMIGSTIAHKAVEHGAKVTIIDALIPGFGGNFFNIEDIRNRLTFEKVDIRNNGKIEKYLKKVDIIFNLAGQVSYVDSNIDPFLDLDINCRGHLNVLDACRRVNPEVKIIFSSSRFVYGSIVRNPVDEDHPYNCLSIYGINKLASEKYYQFYFDYHKIKHTIFRIANPYGPRQQMHHSKYGIVNWFIRSALERKPLTIYGSGDQKRDYIYVDDLAEAMLMASVDKRTNGEIFNIGSGVGTPFIKMVKTIADIIATSEIQHVQWPKDRFFVETGDYITDISKISSVTGWRPTTSLREGIKKTVEYYEKYSKHYW